MKMKWVYLAAAIVGAIVPYIFFLQFFGATESGISGFLSDAFANPAASGVAADALIASFVFWLFMFHRNRFAHGPVPYLYIALNLLIGLSCALPAYLYAMETSRRSEDEMPG
jgi:hypothetical protein